MTTALTATIAPIDEEPADPTPAPLLTIFDRCDGCGVRAYAKVIMDIVDGKETDLLFCAHHYRKHKAKLLEVSLAQHDESHLLMGEVAKNASTTAAFA